MSELFHNLADMLLITTGFVAAMFLIVVAVWDFLTDDRDDTEPPMSGFAS